MKDSEQISSFNCMIIIVIIVLCNVVLYFGFLHGAFTKMWQFKFQNFIRCISMTIIFFIVVYF